MSIYSDIIYNPLYNTLIWLTSVLPGADIGIAVIILTCLVKLTLFPLSKKALYSQAKMKETQPLVDKVREKYKDDKQTQALKIMEVYREHKFNPFSSIFLILIQIPIIFALYSIFSHSNLPTINPDILYSFVKTTPIDMHLFGFFDISARSTVLALFAGITQYFQLKYSLSHNIPDPNRALSPQEEMMQSISKSMKYIFPFMVIGISYSISAVIALYWTVSNIFTLVQEIVIRKKMNKTKLLNR